MVLILGICGVIRSLSRVLLGFVLGIRLDAGVLCKCSVLSDIFLFVLNLLGFEWGRVIRWCRRVMVWD